MLTGFAAAADPLAAGLPEGVAAGPHADTTPTAAIACRNRLREILAVFPPSIARPLQRVVARTIGRGPSSWSVDRRRHDTAQSKQREPARDDRADVRVVRLRRPLREEERHEDEACADEDRGAQRRRAPEARDEH